jgi:flagellar motor component MotA
MRRENWIGVIGMVLIGLLLGPGEKIFGYGWNFILIIGVAGIFSWLYNRMKKKEDKTQATTEAPGPKHEEKYDR